MSHGEFRDRKKNHNHERKIHKAQTRFERRWSRFDREQDQLEALQVLASRQQRDLSAIEENRSPDEA